MKHASRFDELAKKQAPFASLTGRCGGFLLLVALVAVGASGQGIQARQSISFDRPEAWAMKYFAAVSLATSLGEPRSMEWGEWELAAEIGWIPKLDEDQRRVGFNGTKVEDINRVGVLLRPRITGALGRTWSVDLAWLPPVEIDGVRSNVVSLGVNRPLVETAGFVLGLRAYGQLGAIEGDFTCSAADAAIPPGAEGNEYGCEAASADRVRLDVAGVAVVSGWRVGDRGGSVQAGAYASYNDLGFQVDAFTYGEHDRTLLVTNGWTYALTVGGSWPLGGDVAVAAELFYSPLRVRRERDAAPENDAVLNLRALLSYAF